MYIYNIIYIYVYCIYHILYKIYYIIYDILYTFYCSWLETLQCRLHACSTQNLGTVTKQVNTCETCENQKGGKGGGQYIYIIYYGFLTSWGIPKSHGQSVCLASAETWFHHSTSWDGRSVKFFCGEKATIAKYKPIWVWINTYENTSFYWMNIHKSQLFWCELQGYQGFDTLLYDTRSMGISGSDSMEVR